MEEVVEDGRQPSRSQGHPVGGGLLPGPNRYPFTGRRKRPAAGKAGKEVADAEVAIYFAKVRSRSRGRNRRRATRGWWQAQRRRSNSPRSVRSRRGSNRWRRNRPSRARRPPKIPTSASVVYSTELDFPAEGEYRPAVADQGKGRVGGNPSQHQGGRIRKDPEARGEGAADPDADREERRRRTRGS